ncbi:MAG: type VII toxin-antitoxin system MntA family adenylyltransferase antitoxin [Mariniphaga sp.]
MKYDRNILAEILKTIPEIAFAYLFGSAQNGTINEGSDLDIAVYLTEEGKNKNEKTELRLKILRMLESAVPGFDNFDVVILNNASTFLGMQALQGTLLFVKPEHEDLYVDFYSYTCRKFEYDTFWMKKQLEYRGYEIEWDY